VVEGCAERFCEAQAATMELRLSNSCKAVAVVRTTGGSVRRVQPLRLQSPNYMSVALCLYGGE
jgi:hypothetical protein